MQIIDLTTAGKTEAVFYNLFTNYFLREIASVHLFQAMK